MPGESKALDTGSIPTNGEAAGLPLAVHLPEPRHEYEPPQPPANGTVTDAGIQPGRSNLLGRRLRSAAPWLISAGAFFIYSLISVLRYERRESMSWDLGIFTQAVRAYAHFQAPMVNIRGQNLDLLGDHWHPILMLLGPVFRVFPSPITLLVAQSFLLALAAVPLTRTAMDLLGPRQGSAIGIAYGLSWGVVQAANFDFHEVAFAVPALAFSLCAYIRRDDARTVLWSLPLLFVKEDLALLVPVIIAMVVARTRLRGRAGYQGAAIGVGVACGALLTSFLVKVVIPHFNPDNAYLYWKEGGCLDPGQHAGLGRLMTCVPGQLLDGLGVKERTILLTLLPVAFVAVRSPLVLLAVPAMLARFVNVGSAYWGTDFHYSVIPMVIVFAAAVHGLVLMKESREAAARRQASRKPQDQHRIQAPPQPSRRSGSPVQGWLRAVGDAQLKHGAVAMLAVAAALTQSFPLQDLWHHETWFPDAHVAAVKRGEAAVPSGVTVETTVTMLPALAARTEALWIGNPNIVEPPEYEAFDIDRAGWNGQPSALDFVRSRHPGYGYEQVFADAANNVYVFRRTD
ncbi:DUF2079 domain-containing protein [Catenulispora subtropica]|uniref:DUF2079 domain-containing protein n=1 Tax=Catenulispora subtropica TaxID=450798 RepID=A0ABP5DFD3_9ACTN